MSRDDVATCLGDHHRVAVPLARADVAQVHLAGRLRRAARGALVPVVGAVELHRIAAHEPAFVEGLRTSVVLERHARSTEIVALDLDLAGDHLGGSAERRARISGREHAGHIAVERNAASTALTAASLPAPPAPTTAASGASWPAVPVIPPVDAPPVDDDVPADNPPCPPEEALLTPAAPPSSVDVALPAGPSATGDESEEEHPSDVAKVTTKGRWLSVVQKSQPTSLDGFGDALAALPMHAAVRCRGQERRPLWYCASVGQHHGAFESTVGWHRHSVARRRWLLLRGRWSRRSRPKWSCRRGDSVTAGNGGSNVGSAGAGGSSDAGGLPGADAGTGDGAAPVVGNCSPPDDIYSPIPSLINTGCVDPKDTDEAHGASGYL